MGHAPNSYNTHIYQWNTNGLITHFQEFKHTIQTLQPHIMCVQETHLKPSDHYTLQFYPYTLIRKDHPACTRRGGVATYIKHNIPHKDTTPNTTSDIQTLEIYINSQTITLINCYFPPADDNFDTKLNDLDHILNNTHTPIILLGDFNSHHPLWESSTRTDTRGHKIHNLIHNHHLVCLNTGHHTLPSRYIPQQDTTPDITFASPQISRSSQWITLEDTLFSDHKIIQLTLNAKSTDHTTQSRWNLKHAAWDAYTTDMEQTNFKVTDLEKFSSSLLACAQQHVPRTTPHTQKQKAVPWWNTDCDTAIKQRKRALNRHKRYNTQQTQDTYKRAKAHCRKTILQAKREAWQEHISQFNRFTPLSKIWSLTKAFTNNKQSLIESLAITHNNTTITDPQAITDIFATHYLSRSSALPNPIPLNITDTQSQETFNAPITLQELNNAIKQSGNTSVGPDNIHYSFLKHLGPTAKQALLDSFNTAYTTHTYPDTWFHAHIIPIPKPNKDTTLPENYRPISLTSCIHKTFERIIKDRLLHHITTRKVLSHIHSGFLPGRSTTDNLIRLTADIQNGFADRSCTTALFLDIKHAYDTLNISSLLTYLQHIGLTGHIIAYLNHYLTTRTFQVKHLTHLSQTQYPSTGLMQGSVLSPVLFVLALNSQLQDTYKPVQVATYADDIALWTTHRHVESALAHLQKALNTIIPKLTSLNLELSPHKTQCIVFGRYNLTNTTTLTLNNTHIPFADTAKFLGITFDKHFTFKQHITDITGRALKRTNILRALTGTQWGGDRATLTTLYTSLIRPILEYGSITFENAAPTHLKKLDRVQNQCLRTITGAFPTSPTLALHVYNNTTPLHYRRTQTLFRYFFRIQHIPNHPCTPLIKKKAQRKYTAPSRSRLKVTVGGRLSQLAQQYNITLPTTRPAPPLPPYWEDSAPTTHFLIDQPKHTITDTEIHQHFTQFIHHHKPDHIIYTDGSKHEHRTAAAAVLTSPQSPPTTTFRARLPDNTSIYTAELYAIYTAYLTIQEKNLTKTIIATDSKASLEAINHTTIKPTHPIIHIILELHNELDTQYQPMLLWLPGHCGIPGNTLADKEANSAIHHPRIHHIPMSTKDYFPTLNTQLTSHFQEEWHNTHTALKQIHPTIELWPSTNLNCRLHEKSLTRLRIGHTFITHGYILQNKPKPTCTHCNTPLTVSHILLTCSLYQQERAPLTHYCAQHNIQLTLPNVLGDEYPDIVSLILEFIHTTGLIKRL